MLSPALTPHVKPPEVVTAETAAIVDRSAWLHHPLTVRHLKALNEQLRVHQLNAQILSRVENKSFDALIQLRSADVLSTVIEELLAP